VVGGGADNACGAIGVGAIAEGRVVASWGTSGTMLSSTARPLIDDAMRAHTFCHAVSGTWYTMGVMLTAGAAFAWYARQILAEGGRDLERLTREAAEVAPGSDGVLFLPYLQGERTPHRDVTARGAFVGLSLAHGRAHLARAVLEGICFGMRDSLELLKEVGIRPRQLLLTGGGASSELVRQLQADIYGVPVAQAAHEQGPAFGAALLAAVGVDAFRSVAAACKNALQLRSPLRPRRAAHRAYDAPYARYRALYPALRSAAVTRHESQP
jgi:xylulokinase